MLPPTIESEPPCEPALTAVMVRLSPASVRIVSQHVQTGHATILSDSEAVVGGRRIIIDRRSR